MSLLYKILLNKIVRILQRKQSKSKRQESNKEIDYPFKLIEDKMKLNKYDRQIRIWGTEGQKKLSQAKVAILKCSPAGIQAAKNLILPGVGQIDIIDDQIVCIKDLSSSFFYSQDSVGKYKCEQASKNLLQMNPDVSGTSYKLSVNEFVNSKEEILKTYNLVICADLKNVENHQISIKCWEMNIPVIFISSVGFLFHIRNQSQLHVVESENITFRKYYLRFDNPFQELQNYGNSKNLHSIIQQLKNYNQSNQAEHNQSNEIENQAVIELYKKFSQINSLVFLIESFKYIRKHQIPTFTNVKILLNQWKLLVGQKYQQSIAEAIKKSSLLFQTENNFMLYFNILKDQQVQNSSKYLNDVNQSNFVYIFLKAVDVFYQKLKYLPQPIRVPDIHTSTKDYIDLVNVYKFEHEKHKLIIKQIIKDWDKNFPINEQLLSQYINQIDALQVVRMSCYSEEIVSPKLSSIENQQALNAVIGLKSYKEFQLKFGYSPKQQNIESLILIAKQISQRCKVSQIDVRYLQQICRFQGQSLINISSIAGAIAAQQAIKLITHCFTPQINGYLFNGITSHGFSVNL